jgi:hypothetical protein
MQNISYSVTQSDRISNLINLSNYNETQTTQIPWGKIIVATTVLIVIGVLIYEHSNREREGRK